MTQRAYVAHKFFDGFILLIILILSAKIAHFCYMQSSVINLINRPTASSCGIFFTTACSPLNPNYALEKKGKSIQLFEMLQVEMPECLRV